MKNVFTTITFLVLVLNMTAQEKNLETFYEKSGGLRTPRYDETVAYCKKLDAASPLITYTTFGTSPQGRALPLLIVDSKGRTDVNEIRKSGNLVLLVQACIHAGEPDGKDAGLMLLRDIVTKKELRPLLDHVSILFIPIFNVDGHERFSPYNRINQNGPEEMGWRTTAQNLNLNRDYLKADAPEMQAWLKLYNRWLPDFFVDCHVTDGADYQYVITYALETHGNMEKNLSDWTSGVMEPFLVKEMDAAGFPVFPYVEFRRWHDPRSGLVINAAPPMLSQGYCAVQNRPALLIESHMLKPYKQRVEGTYEMLHLVLQKMNDDAANLKKFIAAADSYTQGEEFRKTAFPAGFSESFADSVMIDFRGVEYTVDTSDLTGGLWFHYDKNKPATWRIPMFAQPKPDVVVKLPEAYIIPPECTEIISRLKLHGVEMHEMTQEQTIEVSTYRFSDAKWQQRPYEGRHKVQCAVNETVETRTFPAGSVLVSMDQRTARVIAHLLEPLSPDSFVSWGFFDAVFEQKEYFETYVMEPEARKMIQENPALKVEFEKLKASDRNFAANQYAQLMWFYNQTPWSDKQFNLYPVGRIMDGEIVKKLR
jgi:hypothetical protein